MVGSRGSAPRIITSDMPSERVQRQLDALLDEAETAIRAEDWDTVQARCNAVLRLDPENEDARAYLEAALRTAPGYGRGHGPLNHAVTVHPLEGWPQ